MTNINKSVKFSFMKKTSIFIKFLVIFTLLFSSIIKADNAMPNDCQHHNETQNMHTEMEMNHNNHSDMKHSMDCDNCCNEENKNNIHDCDICDNCNDFVNNVQILNNIYIMLQILLDY